MTTADIIGVCAELIKTIVDAITAAAKGPEPPTLPQLIANVQAAINARTADWLAQAKADADAALVQAAQAEYSAELKSELKKP